MDIQKIIEKHGKEKVRALINLRPLQVYCGLIAVTSSNDPPLPVLCEVDEKRYKVSEGYKIAWKPIDPYGQKEKNDALHTTNGFAGETFSQSDFNAIVRRGVIKVYIEA